MVNITNVNIVREVKSIEVKEKNKRIIIHSMEKGDVLVSNPKSTVIRAKVSEIKENGNITFFTNNDTICKITRKGDSRTIECSPTTPSKCEGSEKK